MALLITGVACTEDNGGVVQSARTTITTTTVSVSSPVRAGRTPVAGFGQVGYRISTMPGAARCALLAETSAQQEQGLMNRTDLAGFDGMLFVFASPVTYGFWMKDTPLPLSIAFFDASGRFVSSTDMAPCIGRGDSCPSYAAAGAYKFALEVAQGGLGALGIGPGSVLTSGGACT